MKYKNIASIFALAVLTLQGGCKEASSPSDHLLASTEKIHACIEKTAGTVNIPAPDIKNENGLVEKFSNTTSAKALIRVNVDGYMADDASRETDQVYQPSAPRRRRVSKALRAYAVFASSADMGGVRDLGRVKGA